MNGASPVLRVLASPLVGAASVLGMLALAAAARDVPQGLAASQALETFGRGTGPFVVLFGLHRLGASFFLWSALAILAMHLVAARLHATAGVHTLSPWRFLPALLLLPLLPLSLRVVSDPEPLRDPIRLLVRDAAGSSPSYRVEEGSAYRLPGAQSTLLFGTLSFGPWAGEAAPDGSLRLHFPDRQSDASPTFQVSARRPPILDSWRPAPVPGIPLYGATLAAALLAAVLLGMTLLVPEPRHWTRMLGWLAALSLLLLAPAWWAPEGPRVLLVSRATGAPLLFGALVRGPQDVAPWVGTLPVRFPASGAGLLPGAGLALLALAALVRAARPLRTTGAPDPLLRGLAILLVLAGLAVAGQAVLRPPLPLDDSALSSWLESHYLALVPTSWSVLETSLSAPGPWSLSAMGLALHALPLLSFGAGLWLLGSASRPGSGTSLPLGPFAIALAVLAMLQATGCLFGIPPALLPEAALPSSLLVALLSLLAWALSRESAPGLPFGGLCLAAACVLQFSLVL